jgi:hypothetical protein
LEVLRGSSPEFAAMEDKYVTAVVMRGWERGLSEKTVRYLEGRLKEAAFGAGEHKGFWGYDSRKLLEERLLSPEHALRIRRASLT